MSQGLLRFNLCPDEKGTESLLLTCLGMPLRGVSTFAPMKRGLKGHKEEYVKVYPSGKFQPLPR